MSLASVADFAGGSLLQGELTAMVENVSTDTRSVREGELFFALRGDNFDAHEFVGDAAAMGAGAVVVDQMVTGVPDHCGVIKVPDTLSSLQLMARRYREFLDPKVVGITGSNGKTSTKDMVTAVLRTRFSVNATIGNLNNHIGVPLSVLKTMPSDDYGVFEMGMNHPGEIEVLADIAQPDIGIITNVGVAHIEFMKTREAIALEKGMLAEAVGRDGHVILNGEDSFTDSIAARSRGKVIRAGIGSGDVLGKEVRSDGGKTHFVLVTPDGEGEVSIPLVGRHMVTNALLAAATGWLAGLSTEEIAFGLGGAEISGGRLQIKDLKGLSIVDDSYNANPDSMRAAVDTLAGLDCDGRRFAVLGGMAELGETAAEEHQKLGRLVREKKIDFLLSVGEQARGITDGLSPNGGGRPAIAHFPAHEECVEYLEENARSGDLVLVKGSRSARMEKVIEQMEKGGPE
ncbi:MAG: UDP-N-acetylmuramoyl-tripeptide--D-alanyl-D-alanine ligase [Verrucomicrobiota bacterium]